MTAVWPHSWSGDPTRSGAREMRNSGRPRRGDREAGFTLLELLIVLIVIGILAAIAIPVFLSQRNSAHDATTKSDVKNGSIAEETYFGHNSVYTSNGTGTAGSISGPLIGWSKSANTASVTFTLVGTTGYSIVGISKSNKAFCYDSTNSGQGVIAGSSCSPTATPTDAPTANPTPTTNPNPLSWNTSVDYTGAVVSYRPTGSTGAWQTTSSQNPNTNFGGLGSGTYDFTVTVNYTNGPSLTSAVVSR